MKNLTTKNAVTLQKAEKLHWLIEELIAMNYIKPVYDFSKQDDPNYLNNIMKRQEALQEEIDDLARDLNTLMGRQIKFPMADGYAYYVITKVMRNAGLVEITWVKYCDAWQDQRAGYQSNLNIKYAMGEVKGEDALRKLFANVPKIKNS